MALAYLVVPGSLLAYTAFVWLLRNTSVSTATTYAYINPVVALLLGWAIADEPVGGLTLVSAAVIVAAVAVVLRREARERNAQVAGIRDPRGDDEGPPRGGPSSPTDGRRGPRSTGR